MQIRTPGATGFLEILAVALLCSVFVYGAMARTSPTGTLGEVHDHQVAVIHDGLRGTQRAVLAPGYQVVLPQVERVYALDRSPVELVMQGAEQVDPNRVPRLVVRSRDGSSFWFERVAIQYGLDPTQLDQVLRDSGPGDGFKGGLVSACARPILRDELGRFSPEEVVSPTHIQGATQAALRRLDEALGPHGLTVFEISICKPSFDRKYDDTIERRKVSEQEIASLEREAALLTAGREARHAEIRGQHELALREREAQWAHELGLLEREAEALQAGQADELSRLRDLLDLALAKARSEWGEELARCARQTQELRDAQAERLASKRRAHDLELLSARALWTRELEALVREGQERQAGQEARLEALCNEYARRREELAAEYAQRTGAAREAAVASLREAREEAQSARLAARAGRDRALALAQVATQNHRAEAQALAAEVDSLAESGEASVRAALVAKLSSIAFEILPLTRPATDRFAGRTP